MGSDVGTAEGLTENGNAIKPPSVIAPGIGVLGAGYWGMNHVRVWQRLGMLAAVADPSQKCLEEVRGIDPSIRTYDSPEELFGDPEVAGVVIATPAETHARLAVEAMVSGKDVLVEKPLATNWADGRDMVGTASRLGRLLMVGHVLEYHPAVRRLRELIDGGVLGQIRYLYSNRLSFGKLRVEENSLWSFAPHDIALCLRMIGVEPVDVSCRGGSYLNPAVADVTLMGLSFPNNVQAHIFVSWLHPFKEHRFVVVGDRQMAVFDDTAPWEAKLVLYPHEVDWVGGRLPVARKAAGVPVPLARIEPLEAECSHFSDSIRNRSRPLTDGSDALVVLKILAAGGRSLAEGGTPIRMQEPSLGSLGASVDPTSTVDVGAAIGEGTRIWHYSHVMAGAHIGKGCTLGQNVFVGGNVHIGDNVKIQNNTSVFEGVSLEDDVFCGPAVAFTNVLNPRAALPRKDEYRPTLVKRGATLGANCSIVCGVTVGEYALIGAGAVVTQDVPAYGLVVGNPARLRGWVSSAGRKLSFTNGEAVCPETGERYRLVGNRVMRADDESLGSPLEMQAPEE